MQAMFSSVKIGKSTYNVVSVDSSAGLTLWEIIKGNTVKTLAYSKSLNSYTLCSGITRGMKPVQVEWLS